MKSKGLVTAILSLGILFATVSTARTADQEGQAPVIIPPQVKSLLEQGMEARQGQTDIAISVVKHLYLPAAQNMHNIFLFRVKNSDLGYSSPMAAVEAPEKKEEAEAAFQATPAQLQANSHLFLLFKQLDGEYTREVYAPINIQIEGSAYVPDEEGLYSTGYPLPSGKFLLAMAIASKDLQTIGTQYFEFETPNPSSFTEELGTTPIFFVKDLKQVSAPETTTAVHKDFFSYSILQITPNLESVFKQGDNLDIFFVIYGAQPNAANQYDILINYEVIQGEESVIKYADTPYQSILVSQELPLQQTVVTTTTTEEGESKEKRESKALEPGAYVFKFTIKDNTSGRTGEVKVNFEVK